jgi:hypothetical protein
VSRARRSFRSRRSSPCSSATLEGDVENARLGFVELEQAAEEERSHLGDGGADRVALGAEDVPEGDGAAGERRSCRASELAVSAIVEDGAGLSGLTEAGEVALHVGEEDRDAAGAEGLGEHAGA